MIMLNIQHLITSDDSFLKELNDLIAWKIGSDEVVIQTVRNIIQDIRLRGDEALVEYTRQFDERQIYNVGELVVTEEQIQQALNSLGKTQRKALEQSAERIRNYHQRQKQDSWQYTEADGTLLGEHVTPLDKVGLYVPGGKATYPSSVLMNALPAKVAGVNEIIMVVPAPNNVLNDMVLAAAAIAGVNQIFTIGGAQAIAALAYSTATIPKVDKIVGTGNLHVMLAKNMVYGSVGIDMIAGPSEILIVCDGETDPDWIAMDLFSQTESDEQAQAILISPNTEFLEAVQTSMNGLITQMSHAETIQTAFANRGAFIQVKDLQEAMDIVNIIAPEHLALSVADPQALISKIRHAGTILMGRYTTQVVGDYCAGPNHVLPTSRTARFSSPLGVYDFQKRSSLIMCSEQSAHNLGQIASTLAQSQGLKAHAHSAEYRIIQSLLESTD
jgi:histidinol dehydrogenase